MDTESQPSDNAPQKSSSASQSPKLVAWLLAYLLFVGLGATLLIAFNFPTYETNKGVEFTRKCVDHGWLPCPANPEQGLILLAFLAGVAGSFLHAAQSLTSYVGNEQFKSSWAAWYVLRPWIGGILGFVLYFAARAGLVAGTNGVNPFGVVAIGMLGGWFSKTTTDKLQEVFETLFKTDADQQRKDKLKPEAPVIDGFDPHDVLADTATLIIRGKHFPKDAVVEIDGQAATLATITETRLTVDLTKLKSRPVAKDVDVRVKSKDAAAPASELVKLTFK